MILAWCAGLLAGCAATRPMTLLYSPLAETRGGSGELFLMTGPGTNVRYAVDLSRVTADLEQASGMLTTDGSCTMRINVDLWHNGVKWDSRDYAVRVSDSSLLSHDRQLEKILREVARTIDKQAVPGVIQAMSAMSN